MVQNRKTRSSKLEANDQRATTPKSITPAVTTPAIAAKSTGLRYVSDTQPGIQRKRAGKHFRYIAPDGTPIHDQEKLHRIKTLAIPPAWADVWICTSPRGHLQATGRDAKGRKQYRYHPRWRAIRDETKYDKMIAFGQALPSIRAQIDHDLNEPGLTREKVLATIVRLLDTTAIRVGNEEYVRENGSFGVTTLQNEHVTFQGPKIHLHFRGKSGKEHNLDVKDKKLARIVRQCRDLPGQELFQYIDHDQQLHAITSDDVNTYLREITDQDFTAKDFRTWTATVIATCALQNCEKCETKTQAKKNVVQAIEAAAAHLGNTPAICRKSYVHPEIIDAYLEGRLLTTIKRPMTETLHGLKPEELMVLAFLTT